MRAMWKDKIKRKNKGRERVEPRTHLHRSITTPNSPPSSGLGTTHTAGSRISNGKTNTLCKYNSQCSIKWNKAACKPNSRNLPSGSNSRGKHKFEHRNKVAFQGVYEEKKLIFKSNNGRTVKCRIRIWQKIVQNQKNAHVLYEKHKVYMQWITI